MKRGTFCAMACVCVIIAAVLTGCGCGTQASGEVEVPILFQSARNVGSLGIELSYDASALEATEVRAGALAPNAMLEYSLDEPGQVVLGVIDSSGMNGDGEVAIITFKVTQAQGASLLLISSAKTHDASTLVDIVNETSDGSVGPGDGQITAPVVNFGL